MDFEEFFEDMEKRLRELCGGGCRLERQEFLGVNGTVKHALAVSGDREDVCPCVDMGRYYRGTFPGFWTGSPLKEIFMQGSLTQGKMKACSGSLYTGSAWICLWFTISV